MVAPSAAVRAAMRPISGAPRHGSPDFTRGRGGMGAAAVAAATPRYPYAYPYGSDC